MNRPYRETAELVRRGRPGREAARPVECRNADAARPGCYVELGRVALRGVRCRACGGLIRCRTPSPQEAAE